MSILAEHKSSIVLFLLETVEKRIKFVEILKVYLLNLELSILEFLNMIAWLGLIE